MIVVDNSVLVSAVVDTGKTRIARLAAAEDERWILPPLWKFEFTNAIVTLQKANVIDARTARAAIDDGRTLVADREIPVDQGKALHMAILLSISGYDAQYIALAETYGIRCVTDDKQLAQHAPEFTILLERFTR